MSVVRPMPARDGRVTRRALLGAVAGTAACAAVGRADASPDSPPLFGSSRHQFTVLQPARMMPPIPITRLDGSTETFNAFKGKVVLVNVWATWCPACRTELPMLERLQQTAGKDLAVVALSIDQQGRAVAEPFLRKLGVRHLDVYLDPDARIVRAVGDDNQAVPFGRFGMPISYVLDPAGRICGYISGEADWLSDDARRLLDYYAARSAG